MAKTVQIPEELFCRLCYYHLLDRTDEGEAIRQGLEAKLNALKRRELYGKAVKGDEQARQEYLDLAGILSEYRW